MVHKPQVNITLGIYLVNYLSPLIVLRFAHAYRLHSDINELSNEEQLSLLGERIFREFKNNGFVYLRNHGVSESLRQSAFKSARAFFALPLETKLKYNRLGDGEANGYTPPNSEVGSRSETDYDVLELKESWNTRQFDKNMPTEDAPDFSRDIVALNNTFEALSERVLACLETAMGRPGLLTEAHRDEQGNRNSDLRAAYYPALPEPVPVGAVRCSTHSDFGSMAFLIQEECGGLEVLNRSANWVQAPAVPGAVLLIVGDMLEIWTGGELRATKHRVLIPEEERLRQSDRLSFVFFCDPLRGVLVSPPPGSEAYRTVNYVEYYAAKMLALSPAAQQRLADAA